MTALKEANYLDGYRIALLFDDGSSGIVDLADVIDTYMAAKPLKNIELFKQFSLDDWPTLVWPNGFDLSPEMLYERATGKRIAWLCEPQVHNGEQPTHA
jgi:hypothetical protein